MNYPSLAVLAASGVLASLPASASDSDLKTLREEIAQMRQAYEQRIAAMEKRLAQAEAAPAVPAASGAGEGKASAFNPEIGLVLQGRAKKMKAVAERAVSGYWPAGHAHGDERGFSLEHSELILSASIDPDFRGAARLAVAGDGSVEVEEASVSTLGLGNGLSVRAGRFASEIGYQNAQHAHEWDFADASLMQKVLFGDEGYRQDGLQVKWVAPTDLFLQFGAEIGRGATFPGSNRNQNGVGATALFAKLGGDVGASHAWQAGFSFHHARSRNRETHFEDTNEVEAKGLFTGRSRTAIADFVWKWAPDGNAKERGIKLQTEFFRRTESGTFGCGGPVTSTDTTTCTDGVALGDLRTRQGGGYAQAVWQFMPRWRAGYRHDWLNKGAKSYAATAVFAVLDPGNQYFADYKPRRDSVMLDWSNSEFSRLRLQYARDRAMRGVADNQVTLQYIMSLGAHGAHRF
ncbi:MAG: TonB-dependent receptor [Candidatus Nitricoxidivorans perseverans]|uniref:TonB-dependent receptor n=1 Tax=Candidatus Nitricoxidivorans perseverans TaxID=2975601 RepID=A0AA49FJ47_9PROT|nr:MAG: TonB-dependent receptor [Candidatus Nitricoxidivorans perseverans]